MLSKLIFDWDEFILILLLILPFTLARRGQARAFSNLQQMDILIRLLFDISENYYEDISEIRIEMYERD